MRDARMGGRDVTGHPKVVMESAVVVAVAKATPRCADQGGPAGQQPPITSPRRPRLSTLRHCETLLRFICAWPAIHRPRSREIRSLVMPARGVVRCGLQRRRPRGLYLDAACAARP